MANEVKLSIKRLKAQLFDQIKTIVKHENNQLRDKESDQKSMGTSPSQPRLSSTFCRLSGKSDQIN